LDGRYVTVDEENGSELFYYFIESSFGFPAATAAPRSVGCCWR
jgi:hypothetical protein